MDFYPSRADTHNSVDTAAEFVDTFYSYHGSYHETVADSLNGDDAVNIIDLYYSASRPETPSNLSADCIVPAPGNIAQKIDSKTSAMDILQAQEAKESTLKIIAQDQRHSVSGPGAAGQGDELKNAQKNKAPLDLYKDSPEGENQGAHE